MKIDFANLSRGYLEHKDEIDEANAKVVESQHFILGPEVSALEEELAEYTGSKYAITCSSGTDALLLALMAIDIQPGDEVITSPFTFIATGEVIARLGAIPVFVDIEEDTYNIDANLIEAVITDRTRAIMPVSLYGQPADMDEINAIAEKHKLVVIEDAAQSFGATYKGKKSCNLSHIGCTSFFPAKPLGCYGDGGAIFINDIPDDFLSKRSPVTLSGVEESGTKPDEILLVEKLRSLRVHGQTERYIHKYIGIGGRLDAIQAAILRVKLKHFDNDLKRRQKAAEFYSANITADVVLPAVKPERTSAWAQYSIRVKNRDQFQAQLKENGIPTAVHYPMPLHMQECHSGLEYKEGDFPIAERVSKEIMSLPLNPFASETELQYINNTINSMIH